MAITYRDSEGRVFSYAALFSAAPESVLLQDLPDKNVRILVLGRNGCGVYVIVEPCARTVFLNIIGGKSDIEEELSGLKEMFGLEKEIESVRGFNSLAIANTAIHKFSSTSYCPRQN